jgi:hypothetical protein
MVGLSWCFSFAGFSCKLFKILTPGHYKSAASFFISFFEILYKYNSPKNSRAQELDPATIIDDTLYGVIFYFTEI